MIGLGIIGLGNSSGETHLEEVLEGSLSTPTTSVPPPPLRQPGHQPPATHAHLDSPAPPPPDRPPPAGGEPTGGGVHPLSAYCMSDLGNNRIGDRELSIFPSHGWASLRGGYRKASKEGGEKEGTKQSLNSHE